MRTTSITITGFVVGSIWWPNDVESYRPLSFNVLRYRDRCDGATLRDCVLEATRDGDFQSCSIAQGEVQIVMSDGRKTVARGFPLSRFASVADCLHKDPDWWPCGDCDD